MILFLDRLNTPGVYLLQGSTGNLSSRGLMIIIVAIIVIVIVILIIMNLFFQHSIT